jgi:peptidoglycan hydrolase-like protein with peptidoglycan-binding domain
VILGGLLIVALVATTGCASAITSGAGADGAAQAAGVIDSPDTTDVASATSIDGAVTTSVPTTTTPPTTAPPTTAAPTTEAPTTTAPPTTEPAPTIPPNWVAMPVVDPPLAAVGGGGGAETARIQQRLLDLGFWLQGVDGSYGLTTRQAVMAFEKYMGLEADGSVDQATADALTRIDLRPIGRANSGTLVEVDKTKQLIFFVVDGQTQWVLNASTGNGEEYTEADQNTPGEVITGISLTPDGLHRVNRERPEGWWEGDLGEIYRPKYFVGGVAVHGSNSIPNYPASHGCVRVSVPAMDWIWETNLMPMKVPVWVHGG